MPLTIKKGSPEIKPIKSIADLEIGDIFCGIVEYTDNYYMVCVANVYTDATISTQPKIMAFDKKLYSFCVKLTTGETFLLPKSLAIIKKEAILYIKET